MKSKRKLATYTLSSLFAAVTSMSAGAAYGQEGLDLSFNDAERMMSFNTIELREQLNFGLRTFTPQQKQFVDQVVARVDNGQLPRAMVNVVFIWSRKRKPNAPFPYFEIAMRLLAERRGVTLPTYDYYAQPN